MVTRRVFLRSFLSLHQSDCLQLILVIDCPMHGAVDVSVSNKLISAAPVSYFNFDCTVDALEMPAKHIGHPPPGHDGYNVTHAGTPRGEPNETLSCNYHLSPCNSRADNPVEVEDIFVLELDCLARFDPRLPLQEAGVVLVIYRAKPARPLVVIVYTSAKRLPERL